MKQQRIALVSDAVFPFNKGGKETRIDYLTRELSALGYDIHIYTMQWWSGGKTTKIGSITYHAISPLYPLYTGERRSMREGILFGIATLKLLFARFDILEVDHMPFFPLFSAKIVSLLRRKPLYATWHEVWGFAYWREYLGTYLGTVAAVIESLSVRLPHHITAVSQFTYDQLRTTLHYKGSLSLVSNGVASSLRCTVCRSVGRAQERRCSGSRYCTVTGHESVRYLCNYR
jgi:glycosyltransferase involved in cell wall biosynthesis